LEVSVEWDEGDPQIIKFGLNEDGRGMELSELISFEHGILTCDDITGVVISLDINDEAKETKPLTKGSSWTMEMELCLKVATFILALIAYNSNCG
jgi:hypothetical protein